MASLSLEDLIEGMPQDSSPLSVRYRTVVFTRLSTAGGGRRWVQGERHDEAWFNVLGYCPDEFWQTEADALQEKTGHRVVFLLARPHGENSLLLLEDGSIWHWASSAMVRAEEA